MFAKKKKKRSFPPQIMFTGIMRIPLTERRYARLKDIAESFDCGEAVLATILALGYMGLIKTEPMEGDSDYNGGGYAD